VIRTATLFFLPSIKPKCTNFKQSEPIKINRIDLTQKL